MSYFTDPCPDDELTRHEVKVSVKFTVMLHIVESLEACIHTGCSLWTLLFCVRFDSLTPQGHETLAMKMARGVWERKWICMVMQMG